MTEQTIENWKNDSATDAQRKKLFALLNEHQIDKELFELTAQVDISTMTKGQMSDAIGLMGSSSDIVQALGKWAATREDETAPPKTATPNTSAKLNEQEVKKQASRPSNRPELMARLNGIPEEIADAFFAIIDGNLYIKAPGLLYIASKKTYARILTDPPEFNEKTQSWEAVTRVWPRIPVEVIQALSGLDKSLQTQILDDYYGPTIGRGRTGKDNLKPKQIPYAPEKAETRSVVRALRPYTGNGGTSIWAFTQV